MILLIALAIVVTPQNDLETILDPYKYLNYDKINIYELNDHPRPGEVFKDNNGCYCVCGK